MLNIIKLKIKAKHLATEPAIIRHEEKKLKVDWERQALQSHRIWDVRNEARATQLAILFLKGKKYRIAESTCKDIEKRNYYILPRVLVMVNKYKSYNTKKVTKSDILEWFNED